MLYVYATSAGPVYLGQDRDGRFHPIFKSESLGSYTTIGQALADLCDGHTFAPWSGVDTADLDIPNSITEWDRCR
jgi:hypothetical protein